MRINLSVWKWAAIIGFVMSCIPEISFYSRSPVWRRLTLLGFCVDKNEVMWLNKTVLWVGTIVGWVALGVLYFFGYFDYDYVD